MWFWWSLLAVWGYATTGTLLLWLYSALDRFIQEDMIPWGDGFTTMFVVLWPLMLFVAPVVYARKVANRILSGRKP